ncbi:unnamed protein product, partial [Mesorhabditis belari]|uniref:Transmembrane protein n=1 Tax=Mesorhabditis belari TaxID=2138241 RepID=A0AAF3FJA5_9BILA
MNSSARKSKKNCFPIWLWKPKRYEYESPVSKMDYPCCCSCISAYMAFGIYHYFQLILLFLKIAGALTTNKKEPILSIIVLSYLVYDVFVTLIAISAFHSLKPFFIQLYLILGVPTIFLGLVLIGYLSFHTHGVDFTLTGYIIRAVAFVLVVFHMIFNCYGYLRDRQLEIEYQAEQGIILDVVNVKRNSRNRK